MKPEEIKQLVKEEVQKAFQGRDGKSIHPSQITPGLIKSRHLFDRVVVFGLDADLPADNTTGTHVYFATDTDKLYCYNGTAWVSETLT